MDEIQNTVLKQLLEVIKEIKDDLPYVSKTLGAKIDRLEMMVEQLP